MSTKEVSVSIDLEELEKQLDAKREEEEQKRNTSVQVRSTVFALGKDPRVQTEPRVSVPDLYLIEILKDGLKNPYVQLHWQVPRSDIDSAGIVGFNVYRRRYSKSELVSVSKAFTRAGFDRVSRNTLRKGKFSSEKKAVYNIRRSLIPRNILNFNLDNLEKSAISRNESFLGRSVWNRLNPLLNEPPATSFQSKIDNVITGKRDEKIAYIDYTKFLSQQKKKFLQVIERDFIDISFKDAKVGYGEVFEYYVSSVTKDRRESVRSSAIGVTIENLSAIHSPSQLTINQLNENELQIRACLNSGDDIGRTIVYRKAEDEIIYRRVASIFNVNDCINLVDSTVRYSKSYKYRIFAENIHGTLSEPSEIEYTSSVQKITPNSRSNNLKIPIISATQDQNSSNIKIIMYSNDPLVAFYVLERRDMTIHERNFSVPSMDSHYGGTGWESNKFFVNKKRSFFDKTISQEKDLLNRRPSGNEIVFIDNTVSPDHIYQYRVYGSDLFGNISSYAFSLVKTSGKKVTRTPINVRSETLRGYPFRVKISWQDDNQAITYTLDELANNTATNTNKYLYKVQRRKMGEITYETFPVTANTFLVDEVSSLDTVPLTPQKVEDSASKQPNISGQDSSIVTLEKQVTRPFGIPGYLKDNDIYFYRIASVMPNGEESNYTQEFEISTLPELSDPINFKAEIINTKIRPLVCELTWDVEENKSAGDYYIIERKKDSPYDSFEFLGKSYLDFVFYDRNIELSNSYIYRIKAVDTLKRESAFFEARLNI